MVFSKPTVAISHHLKLLQITSKFNGVLMQRVFINNYVALNIVPLTLIKILGFLKHVNAMEMLI
jgi:hypothetical protein